MTDTSPVDLLIEDPRWEALALDTLAVRASRATLRHLGLDPSAFEISLLAADDARLADLNGTFRGKGAPTNVLSWPSQERGAAVAGGDPVAADDPELGDIALAWETCAREAEEAGKPMADHVTHLVVHGVLHLLGYDHIRDKDAALMEGLEVEILASLGVADPYS